MPIQRSRHTKTEDREYSARLLRLQDMGIPIGCASDLQHEPDRLRFEQIDHAFAAAYELPLGDIAVCVFVRITVIRSGILILDGEMTAPWGDVLDLSHIENCSCYEDLVAGLPFRPPILNDYLTRGIPLRLGRREGVIIGHGWKPLPAEWHDDTVVAVRLMLWDQRGNEICGNFEARVDRSLKRKYGLRQGRGLAQRVPIFAREDAQPGDQNVVPLDDAIKEPPASDERDATDNARSSEPS